MPKSEQGVTLDRYMVIPRTLIFITRGAEVLLIRGAPTKRLWANLYNGIGGHIEQGEDVANAANRELAEETGLESVNLRLVGSVMIDVGDNPGITLFIFKGEYQGGELLASNEGQLEWVPFKLLENYPLVEDLYILLPRVLNIQASEAPFSARYFYDAQDHLQVEFSKR